MPDTASTFIEGVPDVPTEVKAHDLYLPYNHLFNQAAKRVAETSVKSLYPERETKLGFRHIDQVVFMGVVAVGEQNIYTAAEGLVEEINVLARLGYVTGFLCNLSMIKLFHDETHDFPRYVLFSYPALTPKGIKEFKNWKSKYEFKEGGVPPLEVRDGLTSLAIDPEHRSGAV